MEINVGALISSAEATLKHLSILKQFWVPGSDLRLTAEDATDSLYVLLDTMALRLPMAKPDSGPDLSET